MVGYDDKINYSRVISDITKQIKSHLYTEIDIDVFYNSMVIVDMDMRESGISSNKPSFMGCEITLYQKNEYKLSDDILINEMEKLSSGIINRILKQNNFFEFYRYKPKAIKNLNKSLIH